MENNNYKDESAAALSNHFVAFLLCHELISINALEKKLKIPHSTLNKAIKGRRTIPQKYFYEMGLCLREYGFEWPETVDF